MRSSGCGSWWKPSQSAWKRSTRARACASASRRLPAARTCSRVPSCPGHGGIEQPVRRGAPPEEVAQAGGQLELREPEGACRAGSRGAPLDAIEELGVLEHRLDHQRDGDLEVALLHRERLERGVLRDLGVAQRTSERAPSEGGDESLEARRVSGPRGGARKQRLQARRVRDQPLGDVPRHLLGRVHEGLRRDLGEVVVVERVVRVLGKQREALARGVAHQVTDGVVVLVAGESPCAGGSDLESRARSAATGGAPDRRSCRHRRRGG